MSPKHFSFRDLSGSIRSLQPAYAVLFPIAAIYAALSVPLSIYARIDGSHRLTGLIGLHHGHEMLFGFGLLIIAGYLLGKTNGWRIALYCSIWLGARIFYTIDPEGVMGNSLTIAFGLLLTWEVAPKFLVAKKWRNKMLSPLLIAIGSFPIVFMIASYLLDGLGTTESLHSMVILLSLLTAYMGGRMIAPAVANEYQKQGIELQARLQPRLEATFIVLLAIAAAASLIPFGRSLSGALLIATGLILVIRLARWRLWRCFYRSDLLGLGVGYTWLAIGLIYLGMSFLSDKQVILAIHTITIGAIGTLSSVVMLRVHYQRKFRALPDHLPVKMCVILLGTTTLSRILGGIISNEVLLTLAATCWSLAYLLVAYLLISSNAAKSSAKLK